MTDYKYICSFEDFIDMCEYLDQFEVIAIDTETDGLSRKRLMAGMSFCAEKGKAFYVAFRSYASHVRTDKIVSYTWTVNHEKDIVAALEMLFEDKKIIAHNTVFDFITIKENLKIDVDFNACTMMMHHTINEEERHSLDECAKKYIDPNYGKDTDRLKESVLANGGKWLKDEKEMYKADPEVLSDYTCRDAELCLLLYNKFLPMLKKEELEDFFFVDEVMPTNKVVCDMCWNGVPINIKYYKHLGKELGERIIRLEEHLIEDIEENYPEEYFNAVMNILNTKAPVKSTGSFYNIFAEQLGIIPIIGKTGTPSWTKKNVETLLAGTEDPKQQALLLWRKGEMTTEQILNKLEDECIDAQAETFFKIPDNVRKDIKYVVNFKSTKQLREFLLSIGVPLKKLTKKGEFSTDSEVLESFELQFEFIHNLLNLRRTIKTKSTYVDSVIEKSLTDEEGVCKVYPSWLQSGTTCVSGDTLLSTNEGFIAIEDLSSNRIKGFSDLDILVDAHDTVRPTEGFYYSGIDKALEIKCSHGYSIIGSHKHPLYIADKKTETHRINKTNKRTKTIYSTNERWVKTPNIKIGDYVALNNKPLLFGRKGILPEWRYERKTNSIKTVIIPSLLTTELAEFLGMYLVDGSYSTNNGSFRINITNKHPDVRKRLKTIIPKIFNIIPKEYPKISDGKIQSYSIEFSCKEIGLWLKEVFNIQSSAGEKKIPTRILQAPKDVLAAFIRGCFLDSKILYEKQGIEFSNKNKKISKQLQTILLNYGIFSRRREQENFGALAICCEFLRKFNEEIGFIEKDKEFFAKKVTDYKTKHFFYSSDSKFIFVKVEEINQTKCELFDISVSISHSFTGNGFINHNSGRFACKDPNYQNLPSRMKDENGLVIPDKRIKRGIEAPKGYKVIQADFSQLEARGFAHTSNERSLIDAFTKGEDVYGRLAVDMFALSCGPNDVKGKFPAKRQVAKQIMLAFAYGAGPKKVHILLQSFKETSEITYEEVEKIYEAYWRKYKFLKAYRNKCHREAKKIGRVRSEVGRIRHLPEAIELAKKKDKESMRTLYGLLNNSVNFPIQSLAATITNRAMVAIRASFIEHEIRGYIGMQVHDSIVAFVKDEDVQLATEIMQNRMENTYKLSLPLKADPYIGQNLAEADE